jgi:diguanylate cyclase
LIDEQDVKRSMTVPTNINPKPHGIKRILGLVRRGADHRTVNHPRNVLERIGQFLQERDIDPTPDAYSLVYRYLIDGEPRLDGPIENLVRMGHVQLVGPDAEDLGLSALTEQVQSHLAALETLIHRSGCETKGYGDALQNNARQLKDAVVPYPVVLELVELTAKMVTKTRAAEVELDTRANAMTELRARLADARTKAETDLLTGLSNRRQFERVLGAMSERARLTGGKLSLAFCDIDNFKRVNDNHGHETGDRVLKFAAKILDEHCGRYGIVARHGGEEFAILFEGMSERQAYEITDAARQAIQRRQVVDTKTRREVGIVTFSAGVSQLKPEEPLSALLKRADVALYRAKASGRNVVFSAGTSII